MKRTSYFLKDKVLDKLYVYSFRKDVLANTVVHKIAGPVFNRRTSETVQLHDGRHVYDPIVACMSHGFTEDGHATVIRNTSDEFVTTRDVKQGELVSFDYVVNEDFLTYSFICPRTGKRVLYGNKHQSLFDIAVDAGCDERVVHDVLKNPIRYSVSSFVKEFDESSTMYLVLNSDLPVSIALSKLPYIPKAVLEKLFSVCPKAFESWLRV